MRDVKGHFIKGHEVPKECRDSARLRSLGNTYRRGSTQTEKSKEKNRIAHLGKVTMQGENHYNWKGGITPLRKKLYFGKEYKKWRKNVFERDNYTCQECGTIGGKLNADHINPWAFFPKLRFELSNGRTLCINCHRKTKTWGNRVVICEPVPTFIVGQNL
jgi:5-methylcytosine-specific restriction endonuclease McrA